MEKTWEESLDEAARACIDGIITELRASAYTVPARLVYLVPGDSVVDDFEDAPDDDAEEDVVCGQLAVRLSTLTPHRSSATRAATMTPCSIDYWTAELEVILTRCVSVLNDQGEAPLPATLSAEGLQLAADLRVMIKVLSKLPFVDGVPTWTPRGPQGGRAGNRVTFTMKLDAQPCE